MQSEFHFAWTKMLFFKINSILILFNKNIVLGQLSRLTNKPVTDGIRSTYDLYLSKQLF